MLDGNDGVLFHPVSALGVTISRDASVSIVCLGQGLYWTS